MDRIFINLSYIDEYNVSKIQIYLNNAQFIASRILTDLSHFDEVNENYYKYILKKYNI